MDQPTAVVVGVGAEMGVGAAVCRRFAREGYHVLVAGHTTAKIAQVVATISASGGSAEAITTDTTDEAQVIALLDRAMAPGPGKAAADVVVFNAGNNQIIKFRDITAEQFEHFWRVGCYGGFLVGREAARRFVPLGRGTTGFAHFAAAKAGLRMLAQSMAREFGPEGIHVAHVIIDGLINGDRLRRFFPGALDQRGVGGSLEVDAIAENYWYLHRQHPSAWTQELDLRPFKEPH